jgi:hypothetical protein
MLVISNKFISWIQLFGYITNLSMLCILQGITDSWKKQIHINVFLICRYAIVDSDVILNLRNLTFNQLSAHIVFIVQVH